MEIATGIQYNVVTLTALWNLELLYLIELSAIAVAFCLLIVICVI